MNQLLEMSLSAALLITVIAIIRALIMHNLPKRTFIVLWFIALFQLIVPHSISSPLSIFNIFSKTNTIPTQINIPNPEITIITEQAPEVLSISNTTNVLANNPTSILPAIEPLLLIYLSGVLIFVLIFILLYYKNHKEFSTSLPFSNNFISNWFENHRLIRRLSIRVSDKITTPLTYGILRPVILLPKGTDWSNESELNFILTHELVHIKRFDALTKLIISSCLCIHWFNPLVWVMYFLFNRDIEISCDEAVIRRLGEPAKQDYALTLINMVEHRSQCLLPSLYSNFSKYAIEERIIAIMKMKKGTIIGSIAAILIVATTTTVFATSQNNDISQEPSYEVTTPPAININEATIYHEALTIEPAESPESTSDAYIYNENYFRWPLENYLRATSGFGLRVDPISGREEIHTGLDIPAPEGTPILAAKSGYVTYSGWLESLGYIVTIYHGKGYSTLYAHNSNNLVLADQFVSQGEHIANIGSTGMSKGPHLHFEIRYNDIVVDPMDYFNAFTQIIKGEEIA